MLRALIFIALAACAAPSTGPWIVVDGTPAEQAQADRIVAAVHDVTGDPYGLIDRGGRIGIETQPGALDGVCGDLGPGQHASGCCLDQWVLVLVDGARFPDLDRSALAHEMCHLALKTIDENAANACAAAVEAKK